MWLTYLTSSNTSTVNVKSLLRMVSSGLYLHFKHPTYNSHSPLIMYSCPIHCFQAFVVLCTLFPPSEMSWLNSFLTPPSKSSSLYALSEPSVYAMRFISMYYKCLLAYLQTICFLGAKALFNSTFVFPVPRTQ